MATFFSGVILDMDGLLLDTERLQMEVGPAVLTDFGHDLPADYFKSLVGVARLEAARMIEERTGVPIDAAALDIAWTCHVFVPPHVLVYATFRSKATGLFQPSAEWLRRGL